MNLTAEIMADEQVELCREGNRQAFYDVYNRYAKPMLNSSMRILNNLADAEDIVQESFIDAFNSLNKFTYKSTFEAWLRRIVINKSVSLLRKRKIQWVDMDVASLNTGDSAEYLEEDFVCEIGKIKNAIAALPDNYRVIFNLFVIDELRQEEIATMLNISHNNVRTIYHRARKKVLSTIKEV